MFVKKNPNSRRIKIVYVLPSLDAGGAERFIVDLIKNLDRDIFLPVVILFHHGGFFVPEMEALGVRLKVLKKRYLFDPGNFWRLVRAIRREKPDIVHTELGGDFYGRLAAAFLGIKNIISTEQNVQVGESLLHNILKRLTSPLARVVVAISEAVKNDAIKRYGLSPKKVSVVYNGIDVDKFIFRGPQEREARPIVFGSIARLTKQKNFSLLFKAISEMKEKDNCRFLIVGEGELRPQLQREIDSLGLGEIVSLLGLKKDIPYFLAGLDYFVLPSLWEGLGVVILEAGAMGLPVLASRTDGIKEVIEDEKTGLLFENNNWKDLRNKLDYLASHKGQEEVAVLGRNLRQKVIKDFSIKNIGEKYEKIYLSLLK